MNRIYFGDNLPVLRSLPDESVDLIYIDPPFNTGKTQKRTKIKTFQSHKGDRKGFKGNTYKTIKLGTKAYQDSFEDYNEAFQIPDEKTAYSILAPDVSLHYVENFLRPRLEQAYRILNPYGSLYFHIDYREVHYCKILLDRIFGRESFINEIIWAYDYGGRSKSRWPAKHDNILLYAKDPSNFIFNTNEIDREPYMAPGLVGKQKASRGKIPTDTWWYTYVGTKRLTDTWWHSIIGTNSKERNGYPTQKPRKIIDRIIRASSLSGNTVLDFFAGSGTVGESCIALQRKFILIDNNHTALEVMAQRFSGIRGIQWINFDPTAYQLDSRSDEVDIEDKIEIHLGDEETKYSDEFQMIVGSANYLQKELEEQSDFWKDSPFEWVLQLSAAKKGKLGRHLVASWCENNGLSTGRPTKSKASLVINGHPVAIKFSTLWTDGYYKFQQIRDNGYDYVICFGISPHNAHCWIFNREYAIKHATPQHKGARGSEYWMAINPINPPDWTEKFGGTLDKAYPVLESFLANRIPE